MDIVELTVETWSACSGYPVDTNDTKQNSGSLYHGTLTGFLAAGFAEVARRGQHQVLVRRYCVPDNHPIGWNRRRPLHVEVAPEDHIRRRERPEVAVSTNHRDEVAQLLAEYRRGRDQLAAVQRTLLSIVESASSPDGLVTAFVDSAGTLSGLVITDQAYSRYRPAELADTIVRTTRRPP